MPGLAIEYRKSPSKGGVWFVRKYQSGNPKQPYIYNRIGAADDANQADGTSFFSYEQAVKAATE